MVERLLWKGFHDLLYGVVLRGAQPPMPIDLKVITQGVFFERE